MNKGNHMRKLLPLVALVGLSACTVYPDGGAVVHSPRVYHAPTYIAPAPTYVVPAPVYRSYAPVYRPYYVAPYYGPRYRR